MGCGNHRKLPAHPTPNGRGTHADFAEINCLYIVSAAAEQQLLLHHDVKRSLSREKDRSDDLANEYYYK